MQTILVVDEDRNIRDSCKRELEREGYRVLLAGEEADVLRVVEDEGVDLVVTDRDMPAMDLPEILRDLWCRNVPAVIHTAGALWSSEIPWWLPEAWLQKTGDVAELKTEIAEALKRIREVGNS